MAFLVPIERLEALAREAGIEGATVKLYRHHYAIRVERPDGLWLDLDCQVFADAAHASLEPDPAIWEPLVRRDLEALARRCATREELLIA